MSTLPWAFFLVALLCSVACMAGPPTSEEVCCQRHRQDNLNHGVVVVEYCPTRDHGTRLDDFTR
jgi:hypothetical protein